VTKATQRVADLFNPPIYHKPMILKRLERNFSVEEYLDDWAGLNL
jgi:hypothetical protein